MSKQPKNEGQPSKDPKGKKSKASKPVEPKAAPAPAPAPLDSNVEKLNAPEPFDPALFGDVSDIKIPEPIVTIVSPKAPAPAVAKAPAGDNATMLANPPKLEGCKAKSALHASQHLRNVVTQLLQADWPEAYARYREIKYPVAGVEPTLEQRHAAYEFAWAAFLKLTYTKTLANGSEG